MFKTITVNATLETCNDCPFCGYRTRYWDSGPESFEVCKHPIFPVNKEGKDDSRDLDQKYGYSITPEWCPFKKLN